MAGVYLGPASAYADDRWNVDDLRGVLSGRTCRLGLWLDSTGLTAGQTVDRILVDLDASLVYPAAVREGADPDIRPGGGRFLAAEPVKQVRPGGAGRLACDRSVAPVATAAQ